MLLKRLSYQPQTLPKLCSDGILLYSSFRQIGKVGFEATCYNLRKRHEGKSASGVRKLRNLEEENRMLKKIVAD
jgi:hypothetical protein